MELNSAPPKTAYIGSASPITTSFRLTNNTGNSSSFYLTMNDVISFGVIVAFITYVRLFTNPLSQMAQAMTQLQSTAAASERVFEFIDEEEMDWRTIDEDGPFDDCDPFDD